MKIEMKVKEGVTPIGNYNVSKDCCVESYCDAKATHHIILEYGTLSFHLIFCEEHKETLDELLFYDIPRLRLKKKLESTNKEEVVEAMKEMGQLYREIQARSLQGSANDG